MLSNCQTVRLPCLSGTEIFTTPTTIHLLDLETMTGLDETLGGTASLAAVFLFLTTTTTALRMLARYRQKAHVGLDDYAAVAGWIGFVGIAALFIYGQFQSISPCMIRTSGHVY